MGMDGNIVEESAAELSELRAETRRYVKRRIVTWAARWLIGFAIIGAVTWVYDGLGWLWWAGVALAGTSLVMMLVMHWLMARKLAEAQGCLDTLDALLREAEEE